MRELTADEELCAILDRLVFYLLVFYLLHMLSRARPPHCYSAAPDGGQASSDLERLQKHHLVHLAIVQEPEPDSATSKELEASATRRSRIMDLQHVHTAALTAPTPEHFALLMPWS